MRGVHVIDGGRELLRGEASPRETLAQRLRTERGWMARRPVLIEEFVRSEDGRYELPTEYKFYMFGADVAMVHVIDRNQPGTRYRFYTADWIDIDDRINLRRDIGRRLDPPASYDAMLAAARRIGGAYDTFVRADFYATDRGVVFSEFAATPHQGRGFTEFAERFFGDYWARVMPDRT
jgi:hypothetical protein